MSPLFNVMDIDDYYAMSVPARQELDEWLRSIGGLPSRTRKLTLNDGVCLAEEWVLTTDKKLTYNKKTHDVDVIVKELEYDSPPPVWKL